MPVRRFILFLWLIFAAATPNFAQIPSPSASEILESVRRATGGDAWNRVAASISDGTFQVDVQGQEKSGTIHYVENLLTGANASRIRIPALNYGRDSGDHPDGNWTLDDAGDVQVDPGPHTWQIDDLYITSHGYWRPKFGGAQVTALAPLTDQGATFDRLRMQVPGGDGFTLWINRRTHLIQRRESRDSVRYYGDYRRVHGILLPFTERETTGNRQIISWTTRTLLTRDRDEAAIPFHRDYEMPASGVVTVPAKNGMVFQMSINGKGPFTAFLDTGSDNLMTDDFARKLGIHLNGDTQPFGASGETITAQTVQIDTIRIGDLILHHQTFYVIHAAQEDLNEVPTAVLGYQTLRRFAITIDPDRERITFVDGAKFRSTGRGVRVPLTVQGHGILADGSVNGHAARFVLDTGNEFCFELDSGYVQQNHLVEATGAHYRGYSGSGYGGATPEAWIARVDSVELGEAEVHHIITDLSTGDATGGGIAGNAGQSILLQFASTWDVIRGSLYLENDSRWDQPVIFNRAGLITEPDEGGQRVKTVFPGSPGADSGLAQGDLIVKIDGSAPADELVIPAFLQAPGTVVHLTVQRGTEVLSLDVTLKDIL